MAKMVFRKRLKGFVPADEDAEKFCLRIKHGDQVVMEARRPRNIRHHKKYWALCGIVADNTDYGWSKNHVDYFFKIATGHFEEATDRNGNIHKITHSISFESMDQDEFNDFYKSVIDITCKHLIPGLEEGALKQELEEIAA